MARFDSSLDNLTRCASPPDSVVADWLLDFGPEGGDGGGEIVAVGTPEQVAANPKSWTGKYLQEVLDRHEERRKARVAALADSAGAKPARAKKRA